MKTNHPHTLSAMQMMTTSYCCQCAMQMTMRCRRADDTPTWSCYADDRCADGVMMVAVVLRKQGLHFESFADDTHKYMVCNATTIRYINAIRFDRHRNGRDIVHSFSFSLSTPSSPLSIPRMYQLRYTVTVVADANMQMTNNDDDACRTKRRSVLSDERYVDAHVPIALKTQFGVTTSLLVLPHSTSSCLYIYDSLSLFVTTTIKEEFIMCQSTTTLSKEMVGSMSFHEMATRDVFVCNYCDEVKSYSKDIHEVYGTGMMECKCCAKSCLCHRRCNCNLNIDNCPECATSSYARIHGGTPKLLVCTNCGAGKEHHVYGVDFGTRSVCIKCTPMLIIVNRKDESIMTTSTRELDIQNFIAHLTKILPYPIEWYESIADNRIRAMYRQHTANLVKLAYARDDEDVQRKLESRTHRVGSYQVVCINKCSLRFIYHSHTGKQVHGIISTYRTKGYELSRAQKLNDDDVSLTWQNGKQDIMSRTLLISKILASASDDPRVLVQAINNLSRTK